MEEEEKTPVTGKTQLKLLYSGYANIYKLINFLKLIT
jgi:hypothetical protein